MATSYPGAIDSLPNPTSATLENATGFEHDIGHSNLGDAIEAIETELGTNPKGSSASVKARLDANPPTSVGTTAPSSPVLGQIWTDSTTTPYVGKVWNGTAWTIFSQTGSGSGVPWAQVTGGTVTEYTKPDGSVMEVHTFTADSSLVVVQAGYADCLIVGGGGGVSGPSTVGNGGRVISGLFPLPAGALAVTRGGSSANGVTNVGNPSSLGSLITGVVSVVVNASGIATTGTGAAGTNAAPGTGLTSSITGTSVVYAPRGDWTKYGGGSIQGQNSDLSGLGVVIVAVQKTPPTASGVVATGGTETTFTGDGTNGVLGQGYKVHTFTADGTLTVSVAGLAEVLVIGGGGGGGSFFAGGGGAGAVLETPVTLPAGAVAVTVGAGGLGAVAGTHRPSGGNGAASMVGVVAVAPGGGAGAEVQAPGKAGGSGGGAGGQAVNIGGAPVPGLGFAGGAATAGVGGGGGGGAGGSGVAGATNGGNGGAGKASLISGTSVTRAGGGGGGAGGGSGGTGQAGGGSGTPDQTPGGAGTANTGSGGGGGGRTADPGGNGGAGGSGIVIVRYKV